MKVKKKKFGENTTTQDTKRDSYQGKFIDFTKHFTKNSDYKTRVFYNKKNTEQPLPNPNPKTMEEQENKETNIKKYKGEKNKKDTTQIQHGTKNKTTHIQDTMFKPFQPWKTSSPSKETKNKGSNNTKTKWQKTPQQKRGRQENNPTSRRVMTKEEKRVTEMHARIWHCARQDLLTQQAKEEILKNGLLNHPKSKETNNNPCFAGLTDRMINYQQHNTPRHHPRDKETQETLNTSLQASTHGNEQPSTQQLLELPKQNQNEPDQATTQGNANIFPTTMVRDTTENKTQQDQDIMNEIAKKEEELIQAIKASPNKNQDNHHNIRETFREISPDDPTWLQDPELLHKVIQDQSTQYGNQPIEEDIIYQGTYIDQAEQGKVSMAHHGTLTEDQQLEKVQITTNLGAIKRCLTGYGIPTWLIILLILQHSTISIRAEDTHQFQPTNQITEPPLNLTLVPSTAQVEKGNFSITVQTYQGNPYIKTAIDIPQQSYEEEMFLIDIKTIAVENHNSLIFLSQQMKLEEYNNNLGFRSIKKYPNQIPPETNYEYTRLPNKIDQKECKTACQILDSDLPKTQEQLSEIGQLYNMSDQVMWVTTNTTAEHYKSWTWTQPFHYKVYWDSVQIYPHEERTFSVHLMPIKECQGFRNGRPISHAELGSHYRYWEKGTYNKIRPWILQTAISPDLDCHIFVPSEENTIEHVTDDQVCVCTRQKANLADRNLQTDIRQTYMDMLEDFQNEAIEDWRFKTRIQTNSVLTELEEDIVPTHTRIDKQKIQELSTSYISSNDLTTLKPEFSKTRTIKQKDLAKTLGKLLLNKLLTNPASLKTLHHSAKTLLQGKSNIKTIDTPTIYGTNEKFAQKLQRDFPSFTFKKNKNIIDVSTKHSTSQHHWETLKNDKTNYTTALEGLTRSKKARITFRKFNKKLLQAIINQIRIPRERFAGKTIAEDQPTLVKITKKKSVVDLRFFIPTILTDTIRVITAHPLPHRYDDLTGNYITKLLPQTTIIKPGQQQHNISSQCQKDFIEDVGELTNCRNTEVQLDNIQSIQTLGDHQLIISRALGKAMLNCPDTALRFSTFNHEINIFLIHSSCFLNSEHAKINPSTISLPSDIGLSKLLAYNLTHPINDWIPKSEDRFYLQIATCSGLAILSILFLSSILYLIAKKPWICRLTNTNSTTSALTNVKTMTKNQSSIRKSKKETTPTLSELPPPLESPYISYERDYEQDLKALSTGNLDQSDAIQDFYASKYSMENSEIIKDTNKDTYATINIRKFNKPTLTPITVTSSDNHLDSGSRTVSWKFDQKPLSTFEQKKI